MGPNKLKETFIPCVMEIENKAQHQETEAATTTQKGICKLKNMGLKSLGGGGDYLRRLNKEVNWPIATRRRRHNMSINRQH
jgi:hypothetical protein